MQVVAQEPPNTQVKPQTERMISETDLFIRHDEQAALRTLDAKDLQALPPSVTRGIAVQDVLGKGSFGIVVKGLQNGEAVAVKFPYMSEANYDYVRLEVVNFLKLKQKFGNSPEGQSLVLPKDVFWIEVNGKRSQLAIVTDIMK
jgi:predicted DNA-binding protein (UPF0251 family)